jgi:copper chaperone NosL
MSLRLLVIPLIAIPLSWTACNKTSEKKGASVPAVQGLDADLTMHPAQADRCPVCAMSTHDKKLPAAIALKDGRTFYFCGPGCMIRAWLDPKTHLGVEKSALERAVATDFLTGKHVDAEQAYWVLGSDVVGPMGPMPAPLADQQAVDAFQKRHGGKRVFMLKEMTPEKWRALISAAGK